MIIKRIECCMWEKPNGELMSEEDWDKVPSNILHRAYLQESPLNIGDCLEVKKMITEWICGNGHEGVAKGGFAQRNAPERCPQCGANVEENEKEIDLKIFQDVIDGESHKAAIQAAMEGE
jgi:hypothetical protein